MTDNFSKTRTAEETESWVYTYNDECVAEADKGCACKIVASTPAGEFGSPNPQAPTKPSNLEHNVLVTTTNTVEVEAQGRFITFNISAKGEVATASHLTLSLKDACVVMELLAQAIEQVSTGAA